jgi:hypothetical protein
MYHKALDRERKVTFDFSECHYIDREGIRWLAAAKAAQKVELADRRRSNTRRESERRASVDKKRASGRRRGRPDRRRRSEF